jgi:hypothetical protein
MLSVNSRDEATILAEEVCNAGLALGAEPSLAMPVPAMVKGHLAMDGSAPDKGVGLWWSRVRALLLGTQPSRSPSQEVATLLKTAEAEVEAQKAYGLWLDALAKSRFGGLGLVESVIAEGGSILKEGRHQTLAALRDDMVRLDKKFTEQARETTA